MEIEKNLVVTTAHVTQKDMELLESAAHDHVFCGLIVYSGERWVQVYVGPANPAPPNPKMFSKAFRKLFEFARKHEEGFTFLKLDADGSELEDFETFDW